MKKICVATAAVAGGVTLAILYAYHKSNHIDNSCGNCNINEEDNGGNNLYSDKVEANSKIVSSDSLNELSVLCQCSGNGSANKTMGIESDSYKTVSDNSLFLVAEADISANINHCSETCRNNEHTKLPHCHDCSSVHTNFCKCNSEKSLLELNSDNIGSYSVENCKDCTINSENISEILIFPKQKECSEMDELCEKAADSVNEVTDIIECKSESDVVEQSFPNEMPKLNIEEKQNILIASEILIENTENKLESNLIMENLISDECTGTRMNNTSEHVEYVNPNIDKEVVLDVDNVQSDSHSLASLASADSGQGSIEIDTETITGSEVAQNVEYFIVHEFEIPQKYVGRLIGKRGAFVNEIKAETGATVFVEPVSKDKPFKICRIQGSRSSVNSALVMIKRHFPRNLYPELHLNPLNYPHIYPSYPQVKLESFKIELAAGVVNEVLVSSVVSPGEIWVQQPLHPSFSSLTALHHSLNSNYLDGASSPTLPTPIQVESICVTQVDNQWLRCQVLKTEGSSCMISLLDIGGIIAAHASSLRQIRRDFMNLPFQASQCLLHGIQPMYESWTEEGRKTFEEMVYNCILLATIIGYTSDGLPFINLFMRNENEVVYLNEKLVYLGHAAWITVPN